MIRVEGNTLRAETGTLKAVIENARLASLVRKADGAELIPGAPPEDGAALALVYRGGEVVPLDQKLDGEIVCRQVSAAAAEVRVHSWNGDGVLFVRTDADTGDLVVEPSAYSCRAGVRACRWRIDGFRDDLELIAPFFQGVRLPPDDPLLAETHWPWPHRWEAALAILQGPGGGFWVHAQDTRYRFKALQVGAAGAPRSIGLDSEAFGPIDGSLSAGGLPWRINVHQGDWQLPAGRYRDWYYDAWGLHAAEAARQGWIHDVRLALCWCPCDPPILEALAGLIGPPEVLLHVPRWRTDRYDQNYPTYRPSEEGRAFLRQARQMGFRVMPHFNSVDMDPSHPAYALVRDFQYRELESKRLLGWTHHEGQVYGPACSNLALTRNRDKNLMVKIHPGLGMWRSILAENIQQAAAELSLDSVFVDVTLCIYNLDNGFADGMTSPEGMARLIDYVAGLGGGLVVGGEGLNEVTARGLSFAQQHLFQFGRTSAADKARLGRCALNDFLFGRLCRLIGYAGLAGRNEEEAARMRLHAELGAIPTLTVRTAEEILRPNPAVRDALDRAVGG